MFLDKFFTFDHTFRTQRTVEDRNDICGITDFITLLVDLWFNSLAEILSSQSRLSQLFLPVYIVQTWISVEITWNAHAHSKTKRSLDDSRLFIYLLRSHRIHKIWLSKELAAKLFQRTWSVITYSSYVVYAQKCITFSMNPMQKTDRNTK
jgi:hypothetical protein